ncbi:MAG: DNA polymerase I [Gammaproteobacteria bacterium]|nr:DNA polymerase I [Gammaproteobacteria bacterium]
MKKFLIIDGNNVMFRAYYATAAMGNLMRNTKGNPTNMIYGFINIFNKVIQDNYTHVAVAFDKGSKTRRHKMYSEYKAGRQKTPDELFLQIPYILKWLEAMNVHYYMSDDYEADDIVASIAKRFYPSFDEIDVLSNDNDLFQLIKDKEIQLYQKQKEQVKYDKAYLFEDKGIEPIQIPDFKALIGDNSDNLPGVEGIGPVTAAKLLNQYKTLDGIYEHIDEIKGKTKERLIKDKETAYFTKDMATLDPSFEFSESEDDFLVKEFNKDELISLYQELDFHSFLKKLPKTKINAEFTYKVIDDPFSVGDIIKSDEINYLVLECLEENYHMSDAIGFGLTNSCGSFFIPYDTALSSFDFTLFLSDSDIKKCVYDYKKMFVLLLKDNITLNGVVFDLLLASYLINPDLTKSDFSIQSSHFGYNDVEVDDNVYGKKGKRTLPFLEIYSSHIARKSFALSLTYERTLNEIKENEQEELLINIEIPLSKTLGKMEYQGLRVDPIVLSEFHTSIEGELKEIEEKIYSLAGHKFNISSPKQLGEVLFEELALEAGKKTKTGYSTDSSVLEELKDKHEIINPILRYRLLSKLLSTYVVGVENAIKEKNDNHIHTIYKQTWTDTGRLSSIEPNLQNLPVRNEESKEFRKVFIAEDNSYLMSSDYSQIELRVLAHLAGEESLINAFINKEDIHEATAKAILHKDEVTKDERRNAKAVNFGIVYGISAWGLAMDLGISPKEAQDFINGYHKTFPKIEPYTHSLISFAEKNGYVKTMFNRRRYIRDINSSNYNIREFSKRTAMNAPIQGSAADILKLAMVKLDEAIEANHLHAKLILTIHDEVVLNVPKDELEQTKALTEEILENVVSLKVPLLVETEYGINLYEAK